MNGGRLVCLKPAKDKSRVQQGSKPRRAHHPQRSVSTWDDLNGALAQAIANPCREGLLVWLPTSRRGQPIAPPRCIFSLVGFLMVHVYSTSGETYNAPSNGPAFPSNGLTPRGTSSSDPGCLSLAISDSGRDSLGLRLAHWPNLSPTA